MRLLFICLLTLLLFSCAETGVTKLDLSKGWNYSATDQIINIPLENPVNTVDITNISGIKDGFIYLNREFVLPDELKNKEIILYAGRMMVADETFINGVKIGGEGLSGERFFSAWNKIRSYPIPAAIIKTDEPNELVIKLFVKGEGAILGDIFIGETDLVEKFSGFNTFFFSTINGIISIIFLTFAIYHILIYFKRKKDRYNLYYALQSLFTSIYQTNFFITVMPSYFCKSIDYFLYQKIIFATEPFISLFFLLFIISILDLPIKKTFLSIIYMIGIIPVIFIFSIQDYFKFLFLRNIAQGFLLIHLIIAVFVLILSAVKYKNKLAYYLSAACIITIAGITYDIIFHEYFKITSGLYLGGLCCWSLVIGMAYFLGNRFVNSMNTLDQQNENLEKIVLQRTADLKTANETLTDKNRELEKVQNQLTIAATTDTLTGLNNRNEFQKRMTLEQSRINRYFSKNNKHLTIMFIDLDNFKYYNDTFGHKTGDFILQKFSEILKISARDVDFISRFGGDEFVLILPETSAAETETLAVRLLDNITKENHFITDIKVLVDIKTEIPKEKLLSCSIGIAQYINGESIENTLQEADIALYQAKKSGKSDYRVYNKEMKSD